MLEDCDWKCELIKILNLEKQKKKGKKQKQKTKIKVAFCLILFRKNN